MMHKFKPGDLVRFKSRPEAGVMKVLQCLDPDTLPMTMQAEPRIYVEGTGHFPFVERAFIREYQE